MKQLIRLEQFINMSTMKSQNPLISMYITNRRCVGANASFDEVSLQILATSSWIAVTAAGERRGTYPLYSWPPVFLFCMQALFDTIQTYQWRRSGDTSRSRLRWEKLAVHWWSERPQGWKRGNQSRQREPVYYGVPRWPRSPSRL